MRYPSVLRVLITLALHVFLGVLAFTQFSFWDPDHGKRDILALFAGFPLSFLALFSLPFVSSAVAANLEVAQVSFYLWLVNLGVIYFLARHGLPVRIEKYLGVSVSVLVFRWGAYGWGVVVGFLLATATYLSALHVAVASMSANGIILTPYSLLPLYLLAAVCFLPSMIFGIFVARIFGRRLVNALLHEQA